MKRLARLLRKLYGYAILMLKGGVAYARWQGVSVGDSCRIYTSHFGSEPFLITIGNDVTVTSGVKFLTHDGAAWLIRDEKGRRYYYAPIEIGNSVFIGVNTIIMPGVRIGNRVVVGAGSVLTKSVPDNSVVAGVPARYICSFDDFEIRGMSDFAELDRLSLHSDYEIIVKGAIDKSFKAFMKRG